jgi:hypothetical protein
VGSEPDSAPGVEAGDVLHAAAAIAVASKESMKRTRIPEL